MIIFCIFILIKSTKIFKYEKKTFSYRINKIVPSAIISSIFHKFFFLKEKKFKSIGLKKKKKVNKMQ